MSREINIAGNPEFLNNASRIRILRMELIDKVNSKKFNYWSHTTSQKGIILRECRTEEVYITTSWIETKDKITTFSTLPCDPDIVPFAYFCDEMCEWNFDLGSSVKLAA